MLPVTSVSGHLQPWTDTSHWADVDRRPQYKLEQLPSKGALKTWYKRALTVWSFSGFWAKRLPNSFAFVITLFSRRPVPESISIWFCCKKWRPKIHVALAREKFLSHLKLWGMHPNTGGCLFSGTSLQTQSPSLSCPQVTSWSKRFAHPPAFLHIPASRT